MKRFTNLLFCIILMSACKKDDITKNNEAICFQTTVINTNSQDVFSSVFFLNGKEGFVTDYKGGIYKTTDSARTWTALNSTTSSPIRDIYFSDTNNGIAVGGEDPCYETGCTSGGFILKTQNGGQTWKNVLTPINKGAIRAIHFITNSLGFCVGDGAVYKTTDGGQNWTENPIANMGGDFTKIEFSDTQNGFIISGRDILKTTDGGSSWHLTSPDKSKESIYYSLAATNETVYVAGQGKVLKSNDNGASWTELANSPTDIYAIHFTDQKVGYAFGRGNYSGGDFGMPYGSMYCTDNGGNSWSGNGNFTELSTISAVSFPTNKIGYAISRNKVVKIVIN